MMPGRSHGHKLFCTPLIAMARLLSFLSFPVHGQIKYVPNNDADLDAIINKVKSYRELAAYCTTLLCPDFDGKASNETFTNLRDALQYLRYSVYWYRRAA